MIGERLAGWRERLADDEGVSLVEILVAIGILGVALTAFASTMGASLISISREQSTVRGSQLANQLVEQLRAMPWPEVGFYAGDTNWAQTVVGEETVTLEGIRPADSRSPVPGPLPLGHDGTTYSVRRSIVWRDDPTDGLGAADQDSVVNDLKAISVTLGWSDRGQPYSYTASTTWAPSLDQVPQAVAQCQPQTLLDGLVTFSAEIELSPTFGLLEPFNAYAKTCGQATTVVLKIGNLVTVPLHAVQDTSGTEWSLVLNGLTSLPLGEVAVDVIATFANGATDVHSGTTTFFQPAVLQPLDVQVPSLTPYLCARQGGPRTTYRATTVEFGITGFPAPSQVTVSWTDPAGGPVNAQRTLLLIGERWRATIPQGTPLDGNQVTLTISATRALDSAQVSETFLVPVTRNNSGVCL